MNHSYSTPKKFGSCPSLVLESKIKPFRERYTNSTQKLKNKAPWIQDIQKNSEQSIKKMPTYRIRSLKKLKQGNTQKKGTQVNPQNFQSSVRKQQENLLKQTPLMKKLSFNVTQIASYTEINQKLLGEKSQLTDHIKKLKEKLIHQNRNLHDLKYNNRVRMNKKQNNEKCYNEAHQKSTALNTQKQKTIKFVQELTSQNQEYQKQKETNQKKLQQLSKITSHLQKVQNQNFKGSLLIQDEKRLNLKKKLEVNLKKMDNFVIYQKELQVQRGQIMSQIKKYVKQNQLQEKVAIFKKNEQNMKKIQQDISSNQKLIYLS